MQDLKVFLIKLKFIIVSVTSIISVKCLLFILPLNLALKNIQRLSKYPLTKNRKFLPIHTIDNWYAKLNMITKIKSCFVDSLVKKTIYSNFGYDLTVVCGVRFDDKSNLKGHAWLCYQDRVIFQKVDEIEMYVESFRV